MTDYWERAYHAEMAKLGPRAAERIAVVERHLQRTLSAEAYRTLRQNPATASAEFIIDTELAMRASSQPRRPPEQLLYGSTPAPSAPPAQKSEPATSSIADAFYPSMSRGEH